MSALSTVIVQLVLLALGAGFAVLAASSARRAASFDVTRDFDAVAQAVAKLQALVRSQHMARVRAAATEPAHAAPQAPAAQVPMSKDQLRALARGIHGATKQ